MSEHSIALRRAWTGHFDSADGPCERMVHLPMRIDAAWGHFQLSRGYHPPRLEPKRETLWLRLEGVPGLFGLTIDGTVLHDALVTDTTLILPLTASDCVRSQLVLRVDATLAANSPSREDWGKIELIVRSD